MQLVKEIKTEFKAGSAKKKVIKRKITKGPLEEIKSNPETQSRYMADTA